MSCMWVSVTDCDLSHIYQLAQMIKEDEELQIVLSYGAPHTFCGVKDDLSEKIEKLLARLGMPSHLKGWQYLGTALKIAIEDKEELDGITKRLYPDVAKMHHTTADKVEHAIRHAVEAAWKRGDERVQKKLFGYGSTEGKRPTNSEFIARLADQLKKESKRYLS